MPAAATTGLATAGVGALAMVAVPADRRAGPSGPPSTAGSVPATAETLQAELREMFRPDQEPVADYLTRIARIVLALRAHGAAISSGELDMLTTKASLLAEEFGQVGGDWHPTRMVRRLRTRFSVAALKEGVDGEAAEIQKEIQAIRELILALGGRQSASADKVWSSPSDVPPGAAGERRQCHVGCFLERALSGVVQGYPLTCLCLSAAQSTGATHGMSEVLEHPGCQLGPSPAAAQG